MTWPFGHRHTGCYNIYFHIILISKRFLVLYIFMLLTLLICVCMCVCIRICVWLDVIERKWVELKLTELGILTNEHYKLCFVLDKSNMFRCGVKNKYVKPLHIIWSNFPSVWSTRNTVHVDDVARNFTLNLANGVKVRPYYRRPPAGDKVVEDVSIGESDDELLHLSIYLTFVATVDDVSQLDHSNWRSLRKLW